MEYWLLLIVLVLFHGCWLVYKYLTKPYIEEDEGTFRIAFTDLTDIKYATDQENWSAVKTRSKKFASIEAAREWWDIVTTVKQKEKVIKPTFKKHKL